MVIMPLTGFMSSGFSGFSVHNFDFVIIPENQTASGDIISYNDAAYQTAKVLHRAIGYILTALISVHILAALKHHFIDKDTTLSRMLFGETSTK